MCSIIGSFKQDKVVQLCKSNEHRGQVSHSLSLYDIVSGKIEVQRRVGPVDYDEIMSIDKDPLTYIIVHMQAPTSGTFNPSLVHPAQFEGNYLWHNGILKQSYVDKLKKQLDEVCSWDTFLLLKSITASRDNLNYLDGSFSCLLYSHEKLYAFRNEISPLYYDAHLNISSTMFLGSKSTECNVLQHIDFNFDTLFNVQSFKTVENPYFFAE